MAAKHGHFRGTGTYTHARLRGIGDGPRQRRRPDCLATLVCAAPGRCRVDGPGRHGQFQGTGDASLLTLVLARVDVVIVAIATAWSYACLGKAPGRSIC